MPSIENILKMRANRSSFQWVVENLLIPAAANRNLTQGVIRKQLVHDWCSVSTETFVYLVAENFKNDTGGKTTAEGQWTTGTKRGGGWDKAGIKRYNVLFDAVELDRELFSKVDEELLAKYHAGNKGVSKQSMDVLGEEDDEDDGVAPRRSGNFKKNK